jgi:hypothetical protein
MLEGPSDEREDRIGRRFGGHVGVGVQAVQRPHAGEVQVAEHILGDQRRTEQQDHVCDYDRRHDRSQRQRSRRHQDRHVANAHDHRQRLKAGVREAHAEAFQGPGQPARPAAAARRNVLCRPSRGAGRDQEDRRHDAEEAKCAQGAQGARAIADTALRDACLGGVWADPDTGDWGCGVHRLIVASTPPAGMWWAR